MAPYYKQLLARAKKMEMLTIVDTDGDVTLLVPWLLDNGLAGVLPLERQAGVDGMSLRARFPNLRMVGHYNKMIMPHGEVAMRAEFERLLPMVRAGEFIPSFVHQTSPGVSLNQYRSYLRLLNEYTANPEAKAPHALEEKSRSAPGQLYDFEQDPGEANDLYFNQPEVVKRLKTKLDQAKKSGRSVPQPHKVPQAE